MIAPKKPENETGRLKELYKYELLDTVYEEEFDELVRLASRICEVPISLITLVDVDRQWFKAKHGLDTTQTARSVSFCGHAILQDELFEVKDAADDHRFFDNPLVLGDPQIRYYAGIPLLTQRGYKIGTLCVIDRVPKELDEERTRALKVLSRQVIKLFELRLKNRELRKVSDVQQTMMTIMAHDIRGPLSSMKSVLELKNAGVLTLEETAELESMLPAQFDSTIRLLNDIVEWGGLQMSDPNAELDTFDLHELVQLSFSALDMQAKMKGNRLINEVPAGSAIYGNPQGLSFVLRNIFGNSIKFTDSGTITVRCVLTDTYVEISVTDTGVGMTANAVSAINDRILGATERGTNEEKGSGMGLKMIFEHLRNIGGDMVFSSEKGFGTKATITIPVPLKFFQQEEVY